MRVDHLDPRHADPFGDAQRRLVSRIDDGDDSRHREVREAGGQAKVVGHAADGMPLLEQDERLGRDLTHWINA